MDFDTLLWIATGISIITSSIRALNIGYQKETYLLSSFAHLAFIYNGFFLKSNHIIVTNLFYLIISLLGFFRWLKHSTNNVESDEMQKKYLELLKDPDLKLE